MTEHEPASADNQPIGDDRGTVAPQVPPMTATLMGRLFVVPALVVVILLAVMVVVILFGASPIEKPRSVAGLISTIEADSGDRSIGGMVLSPKSRQTWQAARELAIRFENGQFGGEPIEPMADRLIDFVQKRRELAKKPPALEDPEDTGVALQQFVILAIAKLKTVDGLNAMIQWLDDPDPEIRRIALQGIADMREMPEAREALAHMYPLLSDSSEDVRVVAALAVAAVAPRGDATAIARVGAMTGSSDDIKMNRATALVKLGSSDGAAMMKRMLNRDYWRNLEPKTDAGASQPLSSDEISARLIVLLPIAAALDDAELNDAIRTLGEVDESPKVRDAAQAALAEATTGHETKAEGDVDAQAVGLFIGATALCA